jgi:O-antigen/teichoic acid export membrane protein
MNRGTYLAKNTALFALSNIGSKIIAFILVPLYTYVLSPTEYGIVDLVVSICTILVPILTLNIGEAVMRFSLDENSNGDHIMSIGLVFSLICITVGLLIIPVSKSFESLSNLGVHVYLYSVTLGVSQICLYNLRGREKLLEYAIGVIIQTLLIAILNIIFLLVLKEDIRGYFSAYILGNIALIAYSLIAGNIGGTIRNFKLDKNLMKEMLSYSVLLIPTSLMWWVTNSSDRLMITSMIDSAANGIYAVSYKIPTLLTILSSVFNQAWTYSAIKESKSSDVDEYYNIMHDNMVKTLVLVTAAILLVIKPFYSIYVDPEYYMAWQYTPYLLIGFVFMSLATFISALYTVNKNSVGFLLSSIIGAVTNIILNFILIPVFGVSGAAAATCISYISVYVFRAIHTKKYVKIKILTPKYLICYVLLAIMGVTLFLDTGYGNILLIAEFLLIAFILWDYILSLFKLGQAIIGKLLHKKASK